MAYAKHWTDYLEEGYMKGVKQSPLSLDYSPEDLRPKPAATATGPPTQTISPQWGAQQATGGQRQIYPSPPSPTAQEPTGLDMGLSTGLPMAARYGVDKLKQYMDLDKLKQPLSAVSEGGGKLTVPTGMNIGDVSSSLRTADPIGTMAGGQPGVIPAGMPISDIKPELLTAGMNMAPSPDLITALPGLGLNLAGVGDQPWAKGIDLAATTGAAAAQGGLNPISDAAALFKLFRMFF